jgi:DNA replication ATP-dependent helicase Dna2
VQPGAAATAAQESNRSNDSHHGKLENDVEARVVRCLVGGLVRGGVSAERVGVISPYRSQLRLLERHLEHWCAAGTEIQTVDRYQGRDKDVIVISLVRSNAKKDVGGLLRDWRRINVAFTRAKKKLLVVGSRTTLEASPVFSSFLAMVTQRGWLLALPSASRLLLAGEEPEAQRSPWRKKLKAGRGPAELVPPALAAGLTVTRDICIDVCSEFA